MRKKIRSDMSMRIERRRVFDFPDKDDKKAFITGISSDRDMRILLMTLKSI